MQAGAQDDPGPTPWTPRTSSSMTSKNRSSAGLRWERRKTDRLVVRGEKDTVEPDSASRAASLIRSFSFL